MSLEAKQQRPEILLDLGGWLSVDHVLYRVRAAF